jgi:cation diffusion facilitator family transporter
MDTGSSKPLYRQASRAALIGLMINLMLGVAKLVGGIWGHSFALLSDAVNSLGDALTSVVVLFALRFAQRPADQEHPYGHTRAEAIAASNLAMLIVLSALWIGWEAIQRIGSLHEVPPVWTLWIAGVNVVIKEGLYRYNVRVGRRTKSSAIIANAWDHRSDAFCSLAVLVGLAVVRGAGPSWIWADEAAALIVVVAIVYSGVQLFRSSASELMDLQADDEFVRRLRETAQQVPGVRAVEKLRVRKTGLEFLADMHLEVDAHTTVAEGHRIGHAVKDLLVQQFQALRDVLIHLEPHPHRDGPSEVLPPDPHPPTTHETAHQ